VMGVKLFLLVLAEPTLRCTEEYFIHDVYELLCLQTDVTCGSV
jgi:hypothetical protein